MIKVGVIGIGQMAKIRIEAIKNIEGVELIKVSDTMISKNNSKLFQGISFVEDFKDIINDKSIDVVFIATPNKFNKDLVIECLKQDKHVFCEKPPAFCAEDVKSIIKIENLTQKKLMYGFNHRHHASTKKIKKIIDGGKYGRILWMRDRYGKSADANFLSNWRVNPELSGGGILIDQGIHMLDLFLYFGSEFNEVLSMNSSLYWNIDGIEDNVFAIMRNQDGLVASLHSTMTQWRHLFSLEIFLEKGYLTLNGLKTSSNSYGKENLVIAKNRTSAPAATWEDEDSYIFDTDTSFEDEVKLFFDAISKDKEISNGNSNDALKVMKIVDEIYKNNTQESTIRHRDLIQ